MFIVLCKSLCCRVTSPPSSSSRTSWSSCSHPLEDSASNPLHNLSRRYHRLPLLRVRIFRCFTVNKSYRPPRRSDLQLIVRVAASTIIQTSWSKRKNDRTLSVSCDKHEVPTSGPLMLRVVAAIGSKPVNSLRFETIYVLSYSRSRT